MSIEAIEATAQSEAQAEILHRAIEMIGNEAFRFDARLK